MQMSWVTFSRKVLVYDSQQDKLFHFIHFDTQVSFQVPEIFYASLHSWSVQSSITHEYAWVLDK